MIWGLFRPTRKHKNQ